MADVVNAITGEKIENAAAVGREKLGAFTALVLHIHFEEVEQAHPLRIYVCSIGRDTGFNRSQRHLVCFLAQRSCALKTKAP